MKIAINATNIHVGGGIQVAISFLHELSNLEVDHSLFYVYVSTEVSEGLSTIKTNVEIFGCYEILDNYGIKAYFSNFNNKIKYFDLLFTVFGPNYLRVKARSEVVGFAQPWILYFDNPISESMSFIHRSKLRCKFYLQWLFFLRSNHYIVELEHVKERLLSKKKIKGTNVDVVYNTVSSLYFDESQWSHVEFEKHENNISLGLISRDYPHKNINILPFVADVLRAKYDFKVHFYVTLNETEWITKNEFFKKYVSNVGLLRPDQCPSFYNQVDGVVFPSLLECFSATPLETLVMKKPLFASDRQFIRDVCFDKAIYFNPLDANNIADKIFSYYSRNIESMEVLEKAKQHVLTLPSAKMRAEGYLKVFKKILNVDKF